MTRNREDLDALLISALYGELSPGQRVELDAHLAAHPGDRGVLDQLALARQLVQTSGVLVPHLDPAPAVSAQLVQAAARRAPARASEPGLWASVVGLFAGLGRHPAMASAAALVLVVGVWGVLRLRGEDHLATSEAPARAAATAEAATGASAGSAAPAPGQAGPADRGFQVQLADGDGADLALAGGERAAGDPAVADKLDEGKTLRRGGNAAAREPGDRVDTKPTGDKKSKADELAFSDPPKPRKDASKPVVRGVEVTTSDPTLKAADAELDDAGNELAGADEAQRREVVAQRSAGKAGASGPVGGAPPAQTVPAAPTPDTAAVEVARTLHRRMVDLVKANKCADASKVGRDLFARFPDYYAEFVANDRAVAPCKSYTERERRKQAEETSKSRAPNTSADQVK